MNIISSPESNSEIDVSAEPVCKPSVLFITPTTPLLSGKGGSMRAGMHVLALSRQYEVHVLVLARFGLEPDLMPEPELSTKMMSFNIVEVPLRQRSLNNSRPSNLDVLGQLFTRPRFVSNFSPPQVSAILELLGDKKFDLILFGRLSTSLLWENADFRKWAGHTPRILDMDDIESVSAMREARATGLKKGRIGHLNDLLDAVKLDFIERRQFKKFDAVLLCSSTDQAKMARRHPKALFGVMPNGFRVPVMPRERSEPDILTLLFVGFLQYLPNAEGIQFFCDKVLPRIRQRLDGPFRLLVVGRKPPQSVKDLERIPEVTVVGDVPQVEPYYQSATIAIVPIRFGGGTRIKILEAMALGCPIVSTTLGAEGIEVSDGEDILLADTAAEIADACIRLAEDATLRANLSLKGWKMVNANYSSAAVADRMAKCIEALPLKNGITSSAS